MTYVQQPDKTDDVRLGRRLKDTPVAIVGMASLFANARYLNEFWDLIVDKIDAITQVPDSHWNPKDYFDADPSTPDKVYCQRGGFLPEMDFNPLDFGLPPNILEQTDTAQLLALLVARDLLIDAGIEDESSYDRNKIGITLGIGGGQKIGHAMNARLQYPVLRKIFKSSGISDDDCEMLIRKFQDQYIPWQENAFPGSLGNVIAGRIANRFNLGGINCVVDAACAGSLAAMRLALSELLDGRSDMMLTGGVCTDNSPYMYMSFSKTPAFTQDDKICPFDANSKGMMIGEGIGMLALKRLDDAERDGDRIYAIIKGIGASSDGRSKSIYAPLPQGQAKALLRAYDDAGFAPETVGLIEAHGTGTVAGDIAEFNGLTSVLGSDGSTDKQHIALGSIKSQIGHTKSTAGTAGVIKAALALYHKVLPPTINVKRPNPEMALENSPFFLSTQPSPWLPKTDDSPRRAGISSFGFGGTNFHIVLEEYQTEHKQAYRLGHTDATFLISAENTSKLIVLLNQSLNALLQTSSEDEKQAVFDSLAKKYALKSVATHHPRLGFVAKNADELINLMQEALDKIQQDNQAWQSKTGIYFRSQALSGKVAALFSGQGNQYLQMGRDLACSYPEMRLRLTAFDKAFVEKNLIPLSKVLYPFEAFDAMTKAKQQEAITDTRYAQSAIGALAASQYQLLKQAGFKADLLTGHSYGELTALWAAGTINDADFINLSLARGQAMADAANAEVNSGMTAVVLTTKADRKQLDSILTKQPNISIANYNSPYQFVLAGEITALKRVSKDLQAANIKAIPLNVSGAFHTSLMQAASDAFTTEINNTRFAPAKVQIWSNQSAQPYSKNIQQAFSQHMLSPVNFVSQIKNMIAAGARCFVEFGPKNTLCKLVESIVTEYFPERINDIELISTNPANLKANIDNSDKQLKQAAVKLAVIGQNMQNPDVYGIRHQHHQVNPSPMNIRLSGAHYISPATREKAAQSLINGKITPEIQKIATRVENTVENKHSNDINNPTILKENLYSESTDAFFNAQSEAARVHEAFLTIPKQYNDTFNALITAQLELAKQGLPIPESLQRSIELFHQHQTDTLKVHQSYLAQLSGHSNSEVSNIEPKPLNAPVTQNPVEPQASIQQQSIQQQKFHQQTENEIQPSITEPEVLTTEQQCEPDLTSILLDIVADKTGYPAEMLDLSMDMEADLGIDSIKRVEILGAVQEAIPDLPTLSADALTECRTLQQVQAEISLSKQSQTSKSILPLASSLDTSLQSEVEDTKTETADTKADISKLLLDIVADKTGYPAEMLELSMDMEADLGIDSIKRVEILGAVQEALPQLPMLAADTLSECRTLLEILTQFEQSLPQSPTPDKTEDQAIFDHSYHQDIANTKIDSNTELPPFSSVCLRSLTTLGKPLAIQGKILLLDDGYQAGIVAEKLNSQNITPVVLSVGKSSALPEDIEQLTLAQNQLEPEKLEIALEQQLQTLIPELSGILILSHPEQGKGQNKEQAHTSLLAAMLLAKLSSKTIPTKPSIFATLTRLDGAFGYQNFNAKHTDASCHLSGLHGLTKTLSHEWSNVNCKALDIAAELDNETFAAVLLEELTHSSGVIEIGINAEKQRCTPIAGDASTQAAIRLDRDDTILVSGGAKGITLDCTLALASETHSHFVLLGRSKLVSQLPIWAQNKKVNELKTALLNHLQQTGEHLSPKEFNTRLAPVVSSVEIQQALAKFQALGASAEYIQLDITNHDEVASTLTPLANIKAFSGLIHGAGVLADKPIAEKNQQQFNAVFNTKVNGLENLLAELDLDKLKFISLFSSAAGFYGNAGQSDYAMANEVLNRQAIALKNTYPQLKVTSFNWGPWDGGMVNANLKAMFEQRGVYVIPKNAGAKLFASQILQSGLLHCLVGTDMQGKLAKAEPQNHKQQWQLKLSEHDFLNHHVIQENPVLPTACALSLMLDTLSTTGIKALTDYQLLKGLVFDNQIHAELSLAVKDEQLLIHADKKPSYRASICDNFDELSPVVLPHQPHFTSAIEYYHSGPLFHGTKLQLLTQVAIDSDILLAKMSSENISGINFGIFTDKQNRICALDAMLQAALVLAYQQTGLDSLPVAFDKIQFSESLDNLHQGQILVKSRTQLNSSFACDIWLIDKHNQTVCVISKLQLMLSQTRLNHRALLAAKSQPNDQQLEQSIQIQFAKHQPEPLPTSNQSLEREI